MDSLMGAFMDRSVRRIPHQPSGTPQGERRRSIRHKLHSPVYASFNGSQTSMVVDLSELLDLHEEGFAVQTSERLEADRVVSLCLELPETKSYIHASGQVIWSDNTGRGGIRFCGLPESSRKILKEWLFANLLVACSNHYARMEQLAQRERELLESFDRSTIVSPLEALRRELREFGDNFDAALQLIAERALGLTGATGAALAFITDDMMICRARAGAPAPPLGAPIDLRQGLSGECVLTGKLVSCEDAEYDPRVAPEIARAQGIGSFLAAPIVSDFHVLGLIEVFSPHPCGFTSDHAAVLHSIADMIPKPRPEKTQPETVSGVETGLAPSPEMSPNTEMSPDTNTIESVALDAGAIHADLSPANLSPAHSINNDSADLDSIRATFSALREPKPELHEQFSRPVRQRIVTAKLPRHVRKPAPKVPFRWYQSVLIWAAIAVVSFVLGYLASPLFDKYLPLAPQSVQRIVARVSVQFSAARQQAEAWISQHTSAK